MGVHLFRRTYKRRQTDFLSPARMLLCVTARKCFFDPWGDGFAGSISLRPREEENTHSLV